MVGGGGGFVAGSIISKLVMDTTQWAASVKAVTSKTAMMGAKLGKIGATLTKSVTAPLAIVGALSVKVAADFEQSLVNAFSVTGESSLAVKKQMEDLAREMGVTSVFSAKEAADAMYYMASAGWKANDMLAAVRPTLDLAAATQTDLAFATETVISTLNQFGLSSSDAGRVTNTFASAISNSQATMDRLGISMGYAGPVMKSMGYTVEETSAVLMQMYNSGIKASTAGTALRMGMLKLMTPTARSEAALKRMGLTFEQVNPETHKLADILDLVGSRMTSTKDIADIFGTRATAAFSALAAKGGDALRDFEKRITGTQRATEMAEMQIDTMKGSFKLLGNTIQETGITIGTALAPFVRTLAEGLRSLITKFNELTPSQKKFIGQLALMAAGIGPLLMLGGKLLVLFAKIKEALIVSKAAFITSAAGVGILLAALGALVIGYMKVAKARDEATAAERRALDAEQNLWQKLKQAADAAGMTNREFAELTNKYKMNAAAAAMAIKRGKEGAEIQEKLAEVSAKHKEKIDEQKTAMQGTIPTVGELAEEFNSLQGNEDEATKKAEEFAEFLERLGIKTVKEKENRVKDLSEKLEKLNKLYKSGALDLKEYVEGSNKVKKEIEGLSTTLTETALPAARFTAGEIAGVYANSTGEMKQHTQDFTEHLRTETVEVIDIGQEMSMTFADSFRTNLEGLILGTTSWKDAIVGIFGDLKAKFASIIADMATNWIMGFAQKLITGTLTSTTSVASQLQSTATNLIKQVGSWSPGGIVGSAIQGAVSGLFSGIFGGKGMSGATANHIKDIVDNTKRIWDVLFIDFKEEIHTSQNLARDIISREDIIGNRIDVVGNLIKNETKHLQIIAKQTGDIADKLSNIKSAQGGGIFKGTELAIMHGTTAEPEIAAPMTVLSNTVSQNTNMIIASLMKKLEEMKSDPTASSLAIAEYEKMIEQKIRNLKISEQAAIKATQQKVEMKSDLNIHLEVKDQLDPNTAQKITRDQILPQILRAVEINDSQSRTKLEEILKMRI